MWLMSPHVPRPKSEMKSAPNARLQRLLQEVFVVRAVFRAAHGIRVHGKGGHARERLLRVHAAREEHADVGINRPGRPHDVGIEQAGIEDDLAVLHPVPAVEGEPFLLGDARLQLRRPKVCLRPRR